MLRLVPLLALASASPATSPASSLLACKWVFGMMRMMMMVGMGMTMKLVMLTMKSVLLTDTDEHFQGLFTANLSSHSTGVLIVTINHSQLSY